MTEARIAVIVAAFLISCAPPVSAPPPTVTAVEPSPSRTPSLAPTSIATAAPSPTADPSRYGVVLQAPGRIFVRRERPLTDVILAFGGAIVWANDDTGLLYAVHSSELVGGAGGEIGRAHV